MKLRARAIIRFLLLFLVISASLNNPFIAINRLRNANVVLAAAPRESTQAPSLPKKQEILSLMRKVNAWQLAHPVMGPEDRNWQRATWYTGVMAAWKSTRDPAFLEQALAWGRHHQWQMGTELNGANRLFCTETWAELYLAKRDAAMIEPAIKWFATPDPLSPAGARQWYLDNAVDSHNQVHGFVYVDSLYAAPALAMLAQATGDNKYLDSMNAFFDDVAGQLFDQESDLYYRDPRFIGQRTVNGKKIFWSRGNGWAFAGTARVLEYLPQQYPRRQHYVEIFRRQAAALVKRQGADGLWRVNLDDPGQFPNPETSGTGFFCFGLAWGINHGVLNRQEYLPAVGKAWRGLTQNLSSEGKVLWGQQVDGEPHPVSRESSDEYVTGTFLLSGSEVYVLAHE
jgi:rhamnogalacturonyl hydrolase YesR